MVTSPDGHAHPFTLGRRTTRHVRHWHKYIDSPLPPERRFAFHQGPVAINLREFVVALSSVPDASISLHAQRGDFSRWLGEVYQDHVLGSLVQTTEHDLAAHNDPDRARRLLIELVAFRYLRPGDQP